MTRDRMTPKERIEAFYAGEEYDRAPTCIFMSDHQALLIGATAADLQLSADAYVAAQIAAYKTYNIEAVGALLGVGGVAEILGAKLAFPEQSTPYVTEHIIRTPDDVAAMDIPSFERAGRYPMFLEISERLLLSLGDEVPLEIGLPGPFTTAGNLRGTEEFMRDLIRNPEFAHRVIRLALESTMLFVREAAKLGALFSIGEPTASSTLISNRQFREFALPYLKMMVDEIKARGCRVSALHICGNTRRILDEMVKTGAGILSLDENVDLALAAEHVGEKAALMGNVPPTDVMLLGTPEDVRRSVRRCFEQAGADPGGFVLGLGCGMPALTPAANIYAFYDAAREFGQYRSDVIHKRIGNSA
jgi:uroporphyrinogen decarboxylase